MRASLRTSAQRALAVASSLAIAATSIGCPGAGSDSCDACNAGTEYCLVVVAPSGDFPCYHAASCSPLPDACAGHAACACVESAQRESKGALLFQCDDTSAAFVTLLESAQQDGCAL